MSSESGNSQRRKSTSTVNAFQATINPVDDLNPVRTDFLGFPQGIETRNRSKSMVIIR
jgi:hypothetical protein